MSTRVVCYRCGSNTHTKETCAASEGYWIGCVPRPLISKEGLREPGKYDLVNQSWIPAIQGRTWYGGGISAQGEVRIPHTFEEPYLQ